MAQQITPISPEDVILWPDGTWCLRADLAGYSYMSDDYLVIAFGSPEWDARAAEWE